MSGLTKMKGGPELEAFLNELPAKLHRNVLRGALRAGAVIVRRAAQDKVPVETGKLKRGLKVRTAAKGSVVTASVRATGEHGHVANWVEYGVQPHSIAKGADVSSGKRQSGKPHPGFRGKPFMRPALDQNVGAVVTAAGAYVQKRLTKEGLNAPPLTAEE